ncbi:hypothetical protein T440DRAFT_534407 [Plenodomus tracheiphilus IPT5]|uniref:Uncharacterized protein n=1 Tax=Plenodomus tracheiphilus IPT5 TaxID=1408161 RepID=A0A6A7B044_9PLEO|nr:hypothetical protein T440DRAFT_534407 [Plenodomus tracheiphilus IPT5]
MVLIAGQGPLVKPYDTAYTNEGLHNIADQLLKPDEMFYTPSTTKTYARALLEYLSWAGLGDDLDREVKMRLIYTRRIHEDIVENLVRAFDEAKARYAKEFEQRPSYQRQDFFEWAVRNIPKYFKAKEEHEQVAANYIQTLIIDNGSISIETAERFRKLTQALFKLRDRRTSPGLTMRVASTSPSTTSEIYAKDTGTGPPSDTYQVPLIESPQYTNTVKQWNETATEAPNRAKEITLDVGQNITESDFGQSKSSDYGSIITFGVDALYGQKERPLSASGNASDVKITISWAAIAKARINLDSYTDRDMTNLDRHYPNLQREAPQELRNFVGPIEIIMMSKLGYRIELSGDVRSRFDQILREVLGQGGYVCILGTLDPASGVYSAEPNVESGPATVVGVI